jgi:hypothetical protein
LGLIKRLNRRTLVLQAGQLIADLVPENTT